MRAALMLLFLALAGCATTAGAPRPMPQPVPQTQADGRPDSRTAAYNFVTVVRRVEPVAEQVCRERTRGATCIPRWRSGRRYRGVRGESRISP